MLHEHSQTHIISEYSLPTRTIISIVGDTWVQLGNDEAGLTLVLITYDVSRNWEALLHDALCICLRGDEQVREVLVVLVILVLLLSPHGNLLTVEDNHMEESIKQQNGIRIDTKTKYVLQGENTLAQDNQTEIMHIGWYLVESRSTG
jgi:hypothetical protein